MGVDINKKTITGALYSFEDLGADYIDEYFTNDWERFGEAELIQLNPYQNENLPDFILGIIDSIKEGDGDRATDLDSVSINETQLNSGTAIKIHEIIKTHNLPEKEVKTYDLVYFTQKKVRNIFHNTPI